MSSRRRGGLASLWARAAGVSTSLRYSVPWNREAASCQPSCLSYGVVSNFVRCPRHVTVAPASQPGPLGGKNSGVYGLTRALALLTQKSPLKTLWLSQLQKRKTGHQVSFCSALCFAHPSSWFRCSRTQRSKWSNLSRTSSSRGWYRSGYPSLRSKSGPGPLMGGGL